MRERNHFVGLWLNDEEYPHLREECEITGLLASVLIRQAIAGVQLMLPSPLGGDNCGYIIMWFERVKTACSFYILLLLIPRLHILFSIDAVCENWFGHNKRSRPF